MFVVDVFLRCDTPESVDPALLNQLIDQWRYNGQIIGREIPLFWAEQEQQKGFGTRVICPEQHSLLSEHNNVAVNNVLDALNQVGVELDSIQIVADDLNSDLTAETTATWQVLYTTYLQAHSPLHNGDDLRPIPLYKISKNAPHLGLDLIKWQENWQACDQLQMNGSILENEALYQLSDIHSPLSKHGYALIKEIEQACGIPTFYYLYRVGGENLITEQARRCPRCQGDWRLDKPLFDIFHFKCDHCRLVSNLAWNVL